jgi:L-aspartate oxidase
VNQSEFFHDVLIIGGGAAGLSVALELPDEARVAIISKRELDEGATSWAQGGIAAVLDPGDSIESHIEDTLSAGAGLSDPQVVRFVVERGPHAVRRLESLGITFTRKEGDGPGAYHLTREGGHSRRRVVHAADTTGRALQTCLEARLRERPNVEVFEYHIAVNLIARPDPAQGTPRCVGVYVFDCNERRVKLYRARVVVLATGGASKAYRFTSNPDTSTGDGIAMAWRVGCRVANMEFTQFHPTCLYHPAAKSFLVTETVRGEGGVLQLPDGSPFLERFDPRAELAPRDIVARAIDHEMKRLGIDCVYLDISHKPAEFIINHFPMVHHRCLQFGFDMTKEPIPVVPAAHYTCGGIVMDLQGHTDLPGLYAVGECAHTGMHGANRLASNSLLECLVLGQAAGEDIRDSLPDIPEAPALPAWDESWVTDSDEEVVVSHNWHELRRFMWDYVGIVRTSKRLQRAKNRVDLLLREAQEYYASFRVTGNLLELRNLTLVADLIIRSALARRESRGLHYTRDFPEPDTSRPPENTVLVPDNYVRRTAAPAAASASSGVRSKEP